MVSPLLVLGGCNAAFLALVLYIVVVQKVQDKFVAYFLFGEYLAAMVPISVIGILAPQTLAPVIVILLLNILLLVGLGILPRYFRRK